LFSHGAGGSGLYATGALKGAGYAAFGFCIMEGVCTLFVIVG